MKKKINYTLKILSVILLGFIFITTFWVICLKFIPPPVTSLMLINYFSKDYDINKEWKAFDSMSIEFPLAVIAAEDQNFFNHSGFDFAAINKAMENNAKEKKKSIKGASTISQQTAKNVFLWPTRSWVRKGLEVYFTVLIETFWGKKRILEVYTNVVELGSGIYGAEAASKKYFNKSSERLARNEAALLAAVLPNPIKYKVKGSSDYIQKRKSWISNQMTNLGGKSFIEKNLTDSK